jgi:acyl-CoA synthetase (AMP-forming)/AMP-acid ligase II
MDLTSPLPIPGDLALQPGQATIISVLQHRSNLHPDKKAFTFLREGTGDEESISYGELELASRRVAMKLTELAFQGKRVLMFYPSGLDFIIAFFGCLCAGVIPVPAYPPRKNRSLQRIHAITSNCGAEAILTTGAIARSLELNFSEDSLLSKVAWHSTESWSATDQPVQDFPGPGFEDLAFLQDRLAIPKE